MQHVGRHGYPTQNMLTICDFDMRFTFVVAGWPRSIHDIRVFNDALRKYGSIFPHPPPGMLYSTYVVQSPEFFCLSHFFPMLCRKI